MLKKYRLPVKSRHRSILVVLADFFFSTYHRLIEGFVARWWKFAKMVFK